MVDSVGGASSLGERESFPEIARALSRASRLEGVRVGVDVTVDGAAGLPFVRSILSVGIALGV